MTELGETQGKSVTIVSTISITFFKILTIVLNQHMNKDSKFFQFFNPSDFLRHETEKILRNEG